MACLTEMYTTGAPYGSGYNWCRWKMLNCWQRDSVQFCLWFLLWFLKHSAPEILCPLARWMRNTVGRTSTKPTQPFILSGSINWVMSNLYRMWAGSAIWRVLTRLSQVRFINHWAPFVACRLPLNPSVHSAALRAGVVCPALRGRC